MGAGNWGLTLGLTTQIMVCSSGCGATTAPTLLVDMGPMKFGITARTGVAIEHGQYVIPLGLGGYMESLDGVCTEIDPAATITIDDIPMNFYNRGGLGPGGDDGTDICHAIGFGTNELVPNVTSTIVIIDSSGTWTVEVEALTSADISMIGVPMTGGHVLLDWPSAVVTTPAGPEPRWSPKVIFTDEATQQVVDVWDAVSDYGAGRIKQQGSMFDLEIKFYTPVPGPRRGIISVTGTKDEFLGTPGPIDPIRRCDGPTSCSAVIRSAVEYAVTL